MRVVLFQSTQPSQAVTHARQHFHLLTLISIHTALAGCDVLDRDKFFERIKISIHTALAGCD